MHRSRASATRRRDWPRASSSRRARVDADDPFPSLVDSLVRVRHAGRALGGGGRRREAEAGAALDAAAAGHELLVVRTGSADADALLADLARSSGGSSTT